MFTQKIRLEISTSQSINRKRHCLMEEINLQKIVTASIKIGTIATLKGLGLLSEIVMAADAERVYSKKLVKEWREKGWITGYPTGNSQRGKYYFKRSELETASAMDDIGNALPANKIFKNLF